MSTLNGVLFVYINKLLEVKTMANVVPMSATAIRTEKREYEKYTAKINAEKKKQSTLRKKANKLLDAREAAVKKQQAAEPAKYKTIIKKGKKISTKINNVTGMTSAQKTAYLNSTKVGKESTYQRRNSVDTRRNAANMISTSRTLSTCTVLIQLFTLREKLSTLELSTRTSCLMMHARTTHSLLSW